MAPSKMNLRRFALIRSAARYGALLALAFTLGCSALIIRDSDSPALKTAKFASRAALAIGTLSISELAMFDAKEKDKRQQLYRLLDDGVGRMTLDDAARAWGPPATRYDGEDVTVAEWSSSSTSHLVAPIGQVWAAVPVNHGWRLRLTFDKDSRKLLNWKHDHW